MYQDTDPLLSPNDHRKLDALHGPNTWQSNDEANYDKGSALICQEIPLSWETHRNIYTEIHGMLYDVRWYTVLYHWNLMKSGARTTLRHTHVVKIVKLEWQYHAVTHSSFTHSGKPSKPKVALPNHLLVPSTASDIGKCPNGPVIGHSCPISSWQDKLATPLRIAAKFFVFVKLSSCTIDPTQKTFVKARFAFARSRKLKV